LERSNEGLIDLNTGVIEQVGGVMLRVVALDNRRMCVARTFAKEAKAIVHDLLDMLMGCATEITIVITEPITTKVKGDRASSFELELMLVGEGLDDGGRILAGDQEIINAHGYALVVVSTVTHPNIVFSL